MRNSTSGKFTGKKLFAPSFVFVFFLLLPELIVAQGAVAQSSNDATKSANTTAAQPSPKPAVNQPSAAAIPTNGTPQAAASGQTLDPKPPDTHEPKTQAQANQTLAPNPEAVKIFWYVFYLITGLLLLMFLSVAISLTVGKWSLAEALSEESSVQPLPDEVKTLPSTSRFIALIGLLGILTIVLGVGYSVIWNLFLYGKPPDGLSDVRSFLLGAACLFAPYLANQLREAFEPSPDKSAGKEWSEP